jgi:hypothetical protein
MRYLYILFFLIGFFTSKFSFGNNDSLGVIKRGTGLVLTPGFSVPSNIQQNYKNLIKGLPSFATGIGSFFILNQNKNLFILTNLGFLNQSVLFKNVPNTSNMIDVNANFNFENISYYDYIGSYNYIFLAASVGKSIYEFSNGLYFWGALGIKVQYCFAGKELLRSSISKEPLFKYFGDDIISPYNIALTGNLGIGRKIFKRFSLMVSPQFVGELNSIGIYQAKLYRDVSFNNLGLNLIFMYLH